MTDNNSPENRTRKCVSLLNSQFLRFILVGGFNTILAYAVYALALALGLLYPAANFIALVTGILISFTMQGKYVFNRLDYRSLWRFLLCWLLIYCVNIAIIGELIEYRLDPYAAGAMALPVIVLISFMVQKHFVFTDKKITSFTISDPK